MAAPTALSPFAAKAKICIRAGIAERSRILRLSAFPLPSEFFRKAR